MHCLISSFPRADSQTKAQGIPKQITIAADFCYIFNFIFGMSRLLPAGGGCGYIQGVSEILLVMYWVKNKMTYGQVGSCILSGIGGVRHVPLVFLFIKSHSFWGGGAAPPRSPYIPAL